MSNLIFFKKETLRSKRESVNNFSAQIKIPKNNMKRKKKKEKSSCKLINMALIMTTLTVISKKMMKTTS